MSHCIACGTLYSFTNTYKGNYCSDCHRIWLDGHPSARVRPRSVARAGYRRSRRLTAGSGDREPESGPASVPPNESGSAATRGRRSRS